MGAEPLPSEGPRKKKGGCGLKTSNTRRGGGGMEKPGRMKEEITHADPLKKDFFL